MAYTPTSSPMALGQVIVPTPGTPLQITASLQALAAGSGYVVNSSTDAVLCNKVNIIASPKTHTGAGNTGNLYFGTSSSLNKTTLAGVLCVIPPGGSYSITTNVALNQYDANKLWVDVDTSNDGFYGSIDTI